MLAYETAARASTDSGLSLGGALDLACEHERIIAEAEVYREWALAEGAVEEAEALAACRGRMRALTEAAKAPRLAACASSARPTHTGARATTPSSRGAAPTLARCRRDATW